MAEKTGKSCPICKRDNQCGNLTDQPQGTCWCSHAVFPQEIFKTIPADQLGKACICQACLDKFING